MLECRSDSLIRLESASPGRSTLRTLDASTPCVTGRPGAEIGKTTDEPNSFELRFRMPIFGTNSEPPKTIELELLERERGVGILNESRSPKFQGYVAGDCDYECWSAEATL